MKVDATTPGNEKARGQNAPGVRAGSPVRPGGEVQSLAGAVRRRSDRPTSPRNPIPARTTPGGVGTTVGGVELGIMVIWSWDHELLSHTSCSPEKLVEKIELDVPASAFSQF